MNYSDLTKLREKLYFTVNDLAEVLNIQIESARVICSRYVKKNIFIRLKNNFYILEQNWNHLVREDLFKISNFLQVPSYISFMTALSFYEVTTQIQQNFFESAAIKRSKEINVKAVVFHFYKLKKEYYFHFIKHNNIFLATKEKALVDALYLYSFGKYKMDFNSIDFNKFDKDIIKNIIIKYPQKTRNIAGSLCRI